MVNKIGHFAEVSLLVELIDPEQESVVTFECSGRGFYSQGYAEEVPANGYDDWKAGARAGCLLALGTEQLTGNVIVDRIVGFTSDTNEWTVAEAAAKAVWQALCVAVSPELIAKLEHLEGQSWVDPSLDLSNLAALCSLRSPHDAIHPS